MIEEYRFGIIIINGKRYNYDVEVYWTGEVLSWWRKESHIFNAEDIKRALEKNPDTIILGTGAYGAAKVTEKTQEAIREKGVDLIIDKTEEAVKTFNIILEKEKENKLTGLFHLTC
ncbi:hypothetical protein AMJ50_01005 [Parcubacteria bacterium DG_74_3]|nr:MAG: hypothetical protein AMJ50_01005 [Parcubacteria bacterium DG_74_3]